MLVSITSHWSGNFKLDYSGFCTRDLIYKYKPVREIETLGHEGNWQRFIGKGEEWKNVLKYSEHKKGLNHQNTGVEAKQFNAKPFILQNYIDFNISA